MKQSLRLLIIICAAILPLMCAGCGENKVTQKEKPYINHEKQEVKQKKEIKEINQEISKLNAEKLKRDPQYVYEKTLESIKILEKITGKKVQVLDYFEHQPEYCGQLFNDFKNKKIKVIKPIVQCDELNCKDIQNYLEKKPAIKKAMTSKYFDYASHHSNYNYKLYDIDFDNDPSNGKQTLAYAGYFDSKPGATVQLIRPYDKYFYIDLEKDKVLGELKVAEILKNREKNTPPSGYMNGVTQHNGKYYIYTNAFGSLICFYKNVNSINNCKIGIPRKKENR